jgi:hypothetical protein
MKILLAGSGSPPTKAPIDPLVLANYIFILGAVAYVRYSDSFVSGTRTTPFNFSLYMHFNTNGERCNACICMVALCCRGG